MSGLAKPHNQVHSWWGAASSKLRLPDVCEIHQFQSKWVSWRLSQERASRHCQTTGAHWYLFVCNNNKYSGPRRNCWTGELMNLKASHPWKVFGISVWGWTGTTEKSNLFYEWLSLCMHLKKKGDSSLKTFFGLSAALQSFVAVRAIILLLCLWPFSCNRKTQYYFCIAFRMTLKIKALKHFELWGRGLFLPR